ncbi:ParB/RepB/Spo0J family partition protein [Butyrivibrio sp.]|uniref:ParB/RepB/Spo0J family partition protein n=1 Tax=Butyrivibrio sp. TaxID=28121 RepID=UPI0025C5CEB2|nr:ParB/RepB/Spo0J family partition protein [Butyrivibrio sp.]MBQ9302054.1 ParB/RepB/Spo0J family partition protein [Butyrivibrio sp.]
MKQRGILKLPTYKLVPHPENPRKDLGDLTEMTESVKKHGILQNLTVVPVDRDGNNVEADKADKYMVIIGHRRLAAAKAAGIEEVPARIVEDMTHEEQLLTMLEENMQRSDLTPYDQAQGFQLMLDLGQTVEDIEEKSGFSKTTIYHRLNMAKLDKETLKEKQDDDSFQLTISDLIELEKIKDVEKRNEILKRAKSSSELKYQANSAAKEEEKQEKFTKITTILEKLGINEMPKDMNYWQCERLYHIPLEEYGNVEIDVTEGEEVYYYKSWDSVDIYRPRQEQPSEATKEESKTFEQYKRAQKDVQEANNRFVESRKDAIEDIVFGSLKATNEETAARALWQCILEFGDTVDLEEMTGYWMDIHGLEPEDPDEAEEAFNDCKDEVFELSYEKQFALILTHTYLPAPIRIYNATLDEDAVEKYKVLDKALANYGFTPSAMDKDITSPDGELLRVFKKRNDEYKN